MHQNLKLTLISAGSNLPSTWGDPRETILKARLLIEKKAAVKVNSSRLFRSEAFPSGSGPDFINAVFAYDSPLEATDMLAILHEIEAEAARTRDARWGPRTLDLDLIAVGRDVKPDEQGWREWADLPLEQQKVATPKELILPHPRMQDRPFVLAPLLDVVSDWRHPTLGLSARELYAALSVEQKESVQAID